MKHTIMAASALALLSGAAHAGGLDRDSNDYSILGEEGSKVSFGLKTVRPTVEGTYSATLTALGGGESKTGNMAKSYTTVSFAAKGDINESLSYGIFFNSPYGASASYTQGFYNGLSADWKSNQIAAVLSYTVSPGVSVYGGARVIRSSASIAIPDGLLRAGFSEAAQTASAGAAAATAAGDTATATALGAQAASAAALAGSPAGALAYKAEASADTAVGYVLGVAYEMPDIALRVDLSYESGVTHKFSTVESMAAFPTGLPNTTAGASTTQIKIPYALTLKFQTGVAEDTLLFGSLRKSNWSTWSVAPAGYLAVVGTPVTGLDNDVLTLSLGVGRKISDSLAIFVRGSYEKKNGGIASRLTPTDGSRSLGAGVSYTKDNTKITAGFEHAWLGDATDSSGTVFTGNKALGLGVNVGITF